MWIFCTIFSLGVAGFLTFSNVQAHLNGRKRGTNVVTRFVRDVSSNAIYRRNNIVAIAVAGGLLVLGLLFKSWWTAIFQVIPIVVSFVLQCKSNDDTERVEDSRVVTKAAGKTAAAVAVPIAVASGVGAPAAMVIAGAAKAVDVSMDSMKDVDAPAIHEPIAQAVQGVTSFKNPQVFLESAQRAGIDVSSNDLAQIAMKVIQNAPKAMLAELPENMPIEDKAMAVMSGTVINGTYREV